MRIAPWDLVQDEYGKGQYYRHRYGIRAIPEWWTWGLGNIWDFIIGNMYADLRKERMFHIKRQTDLEKNARFTLAIVTLKQKSMRRQARWSRVKRWSKKLRKVL